MKNVIFHSAFWNNELKDSWGAWFHTAAVAACLKEKWRIWSTLRPHCKSVQHTAESQLIKKLLRLWLQTWLPQQWLIISMVLRRLIDVPSSSDDPSRYNRETFLIKDDASSGVWNPNAIVGSKLSVSLRRRKDWGRLSWALPVPEENYFPSDT